MTPGIHPLNVSRKTTKTGPQPLSIIANGGKNIANIVRRKDIIHCFCKVKYYLEIHKACIN